jgi:hypothetical protein
MRESASIEYLSRSEAARLTGLSPSYLAHNTAQPIGPPFVRVGRRVLYPIDALRRWMEAHAAPGPARRRGRPRKGRASD